MAKRPFWMVSLALLLAVSTVAILHAPPNATRAAANSAVVSGPANTAAYLPAKQDGIAETIVEFNESATPAGGDGGPPTEIVGFLREHHGDDFDNSHVVEGYLVDTDSGPVEVIFPPGLQLAPGQRVRLRGAFSGNTFVVTAGVGGPRGGPALEPAAAAGGVRLADCLIVRFQCRNRLVYRIKVADTASFDIFASLPLRSLPPRSPEPRFVPHFD